MPTDPTLFDGTQPVEAFLAATAARQPTPGGGSVTALVGALAAAIGQMALQYSIGKNTPPDRLPPLQSAVAELEQHRASLLQLMAEDQTAYASVTALHRTPGDPAVLQIAMTQAVHVPQRIAWAGLEILQQCEAVAEAVNPRLLSDLAVCADLAMATVRCATYNGRVNLPEISDAAARSRMGDELNRTLSQAAVLIQRVSPLIWNRYAALQPR